MSTGIYQRIAMASAMAVCFPASGLAAGVARVDFASGAVSATAPDGRSRALSKGSEIEVGETVSTQAGRAQLRFSDGAYMSLQPRTEFKVEEFKFSGKPEAGDSIVMNLLKGGMRTITGLIGRTNRDAYRLKTEVATIGIRGTEYTVKYTNSIEVFVADGVVSVENQSGSFTVPGGTGSWSPISRRRRSRPTRSRCCRPRARRNGSRNSRSPIPSIRYRRSRRPSSRRRRRWRR